MEPALADGLTGKRSQWRWMARVALLLLAAVPFENVRCGQDEATSEYQVKAAFLFHFAQFVDWPAATFKNPAEPFTYCTFGDDPFQGDLDDTLSGKTIGTRAIRVRHLKQPAQIQDCQILFIAAGDKKRITAILTALKGVPVLTVGDSENFTRDGGIIGFCMEQNKIRFNINLDAATHANLKISAKLLTLAKTVIGDPRGS